MKIVHTADYRSMSLKSSRILIESMRKKPEALLCIATGGSPEGMYAEVTKSVAAEPGLTSGIQLLALDEWYGIPSDHPATCSSFIRQNVSVPWFVSDDRLELFDSAAGNPESECRRINNYLKKNGPIDLCILGIGRNGHLGLNEPGSVKNDHTRVIELTKSSTLHPMLKNTGAVASRGMSLGIADILNSREIVILITGSGKIDAYNAFMKKANPEEWPASFLWEHNNVSCIVDDSCLIKKSPSFS